ncbi:MAG TPA: EAL domain-containing protein [Burkholderiales bacterium]|nr:EAL domain-containing protein [Burkholderiales bacterium]
MQISESLLQAHDRLPASAARAHVLVVDDDSMVRRALADLVSSSERRVTQCGSGREAVEVMSKDPVDLVLLDLNLPDMTGLDIMQWIRESRPDTTVIVVSGDDRIDSAIATLKSGAHEYVRKPFEPVALIRCVENALEARKLAWENTVMRMRLEHSERLHRYFVDNSPDFIFALDPQGRFRFVNDRFVALLGYSREELRGMHYSALIHDDHLLHVKWAFGERRTGERASRDIEVRLTLKHPDAESETDGAAITVSLSTVGIYEEVSDGARSGRQFLGTYGVARDISARLRAEQIVEFHAFHDALTGLPNRTLFRDRLSHAIAEMRRRRKSLAVLFIDLDRFKLVNDTYGHLKGDHLLQQTASRLRKCLRETDTLSRIGGDEFVALIPDLEARQDAEAIARKILHELAEPFSLGTEPFRTSVSIGVAVYPGDGPNEEELIRSADLAMYQAKRKGRNGIVFFSSDLSTHYADRLQFEHELRGAVKRREFETYFQPIHNVRTGDVERLEALVRWRHPTHGLLLPGRFISIAEESGQIRELGEVVLDAACSHLAQWRSNGADNLGVSVNLSARDFDHDDLVERIMGATRRHGLPASALELEITESLLIEDMDAVSKRASRLRAEGVRIAIDDFGTRYSSLGYLQTLPISAIKIDQSFVRDLGLRNTSSSIVAAMIGIARGLRLDLVAEGVERTEHLESLQGMGCDVMQGFFFSRPMPAGEVSDYLASSNAMRQ